MSVRIKNRTRFLCLLMAALMLFGAAGAENTFCVDVAMPVMDAVDSGVQTIFASHNEAEVNETFYLNWDVGTGENAVLYRTRPGEDGWDNLGDVPLSQSRYEQKLAKTGDYGYTIMVYDNGGWTQSNVVYVRVVEADPGNLSDVPILYASRQTVGWNEPFYLMWNERNKDYAILFRMLDDGEWENLGDVALFCRGYEQRLTTRGVYTYCLMTRDRAGEWKQSEFIQVTETGYDPEKSDKPVVYASKTEVGIGEKFYVSWNEEDKDQVNLHRKTPTGEWEFQGTQAVTGCGPVQCFDEVGSYQYLIHVRKGEEWSQSEVIRVNVTADDETVCRQLASRGYNNTWNLLFMIYRNAQVGSFTGTFTDTQVNDIIRQASQIRSAVYTMSNGRWKIGTVDVVVVDEPVTSVTQIGSYTNPGLSYGPGKDVDFNYILQHKDIQLVAVYCPLLYIVSNPDWLGLGGSFMTIDGRRIYTTIINEIYTEARTWTIDSTAYRTAYSAQIHEMLHAVETNSSDLGWSEFQTLHNFEQNGYVNSSENGNYPWYADLMRDTLKNGKRGFRPFSYYVQHTSIPADMFNGFYVDYDGVQRYYINGIPLPKGVDLVLPSGLVSVEDAAFLHIGKQVVFLPRSIKYIAEDAFGPEVTVMGYAGSAAETWANEHGNAFIRIN